MAKRKVASKKAKYAVEDKDVANIITGGYVDKEVLGILFRIKFPTPMVEQECSAIYSRYFHKYRNDNIPSIKDLKEEAKGGMSKEEAEEKAEKLIEYVEVKNELDAIDDKAQASQLSQEDLAKRNDLRMKLMLLSREIVDDVENTCDYLAAQMRDLFKVYKCVQKIDGKGKCKPLADSFTEFADGEYTMAFLNELLFACSTIWERDLTPLFERNPEKEDGSQ